MSSQSPLQAVPLRRLRRVTGPGWWPLCHVAILHVSLPGDGEGVGEGETDPSICFGLFYSPFDYAASSGTLTARGVGSALEFDRADIPQHHKSWSKFRQAEASRKIQQIWYRSLETLPPPTLCCWRPAQGFSPLTHGQCPCFCWAQLLFFFDSISAFGTSLDCLSKKTELVCITAPEESGVIESARREECCGIPPLVIFMRNCRHHLTGCLMGQVIELWFMTQFTVPLESVGSLFPPSAVRFTAAQTLRQSQTEASLFKLYNLINLATIIAKTSTSTLATAQFQSAVFCRSYSSCHWKLHYFAKHI